MTLCPIRLDLDPLTSSPPLIELELLKTHLAVDFPDLDELIALNLAAAVDAFEGATHRTVVSREHRWVLRDFPHVTYQRIRLPRGKTRSVAKIEVDRRAGLLTLRGPSSGSPVGTDYMEDLRGDDGALIMPPAGASWPSAELDRPAPVTITFTAGWDAAEVPADVQRALMFWVRAGVDDERGTIDPAKLTANRQTFEALVSGWRLIRWY
jgi:uncharacterized phiE125 gp8 family phage protein